MEHRPHCTYRPAGNRSLVSQVEVPQIQYQERIVEVPQVQIQEVVKHVPRVEIQERVVEVRGIRTECIRNE